MPKASALPTLVPSELPSSVFSHPLSHYYPSVAVWLLDTPTSPWPSLGWVLLSAPTNGLFTPPPPANALLFVFFFFFLSLLLHSVSNRLIDSCFSLGFKAQTVWQIQSLISKSSVTRTSAFQRPDTLSPQFCPRPRLSPS